MANTRVSKPGNEYEQKKVNDDEAHDKEKYEKMNKKKRREEREREQDKRWWKRSCRRFIFLISNQHFYNVH